MTKDLPPGWTLSTLGTVCTKPQYGWTTKAKSADGSVRLLRTTDITPGTIDWDSVPFCTEEPADVSKYELHPNDIVISRAGSVGVSILLRNVPEEAAVFASYLIRFCPKGDHDPRYLAYFLHTRDYWKAISERSSGIALPNVNARKLRSIKIPIAPPEEQRRIVAKIEELFSDLDAGVTALERANANLKRYRSAVLKAAVEGKLTEQWRAEHPDVEPASALLERILAERRKKWEEEQLRKYEAKGKKLPKGWKGRYKEPLQPKQVSRSLPPTWCWCSLDQVSTLVTSGSRDWSAYYADAGARFIRTQDIRTNELVMESAARVDLPERIEGKRTLLRVGDILITITGANVGRCAVVPPRIGEAYVSQSVALVRPVDPIVSHYVHILSQAPEVGRKTQLEAMAYGMGRPVLNLTNVRELQIPLPSAEELQAIAMHRELHESHIRMHSATVDESLGRTDNLRQTILKAAFTGRFKTR